MNARHCTGHPSRGSAPHRAAAAALVALALTAALGSPAIGTAEAAELYRWVEPDGSVTFSPNPPPAGVAFETVEAGGGASDSTAPAAPAAAVARPPAAPSPVATPAPRALPEPLPDAAVADTRYAPAPPPAPGAGVAYAPPPMGAAVSGVTRESLLPGTPADGAAAVPAADDAAAARTDTVDARRRAQCRELEKRVVSLERSLMTEMPPERMDDTVLSMARYQSSLDGHCRR